MKMLRCVGIALGLTGCASVSSADHFDAPASLHADVIFLGRIVEAVDASIFFGDVAADARGYLFEVVGQPGITFQAVGWKVTCTEEPLGDGAMLVFARRARPEIGTESPFFVFACPVVDSKVIQQLRGMERY